MIDKFKTGNPIWVYYNDIDSGANLTVPQLLRGFIGQEYQIEQKQFPNYRYVKTEGETKGTFDMRQRIVHLFYRKQNWGEVQSIEMYLHLDAPTQVFDTAGGMPVGVPLPADITVKSFHRVATKNGQFWYEIGADQWIKYDQMHVVDNPFNQDIRKEKSKLINNLTVIPLKNVHAKVDYLHNKSINVYDAPYGNKVAEIPNGETITLIGKLNDNDEITWYQVGRKKYITSNYIQIEYPEDDE